MADNPIPFLAPTTAPNQPPTVLHPDMPVYNPATNLFDRQPPAHPCFRPRRAYLPLRGTAVSAAAINTATALFDSQHHVRWPTQSQLCYAPTPSSAEPTTTNP
ncbi:hypothetical protein B0H13DRAFT_2339889 [Mycena leptocephala]|nr:hypothetical protein B0H13DRAFT_2339889 [Mycena leptocephala]